MASVVPNLVTLQSFEVVFVRFAELCPFMGISAVGAILGPFFRAKPMTFIPCFQAKHNHV